MSHYAYAKVADSVVMVGVLVGFHDDGHKTARALRGKFLAQLVARLSEPNDVTEATLRDDAAEILADQERSRDICLSACIVVRKSVSARLVAAGHYDVWCATPAAISHVLVGASVWNAAVAAGGQADGMYKNMSVSALSCDRSKSVVQVVNVALQPADMIIVTAGNVDPEFARRHGSVGGHNAIAVAFDDGNEINVAGFGCFRRSSSIAPPFPPR